MQTALSIFFFALSGALAYWLWLHPLLRARPELKEFYDATESWWKAVWMKLDGIRTKFAAKFVMIASALVWLHDTVITPLLPSIDWTPITADLPAWVWPVFMFLLGAMFLWLRTVADKTQQVEVEAIQQGATLSEAKVISGNMPNLATAEERVKAEVPPSG